VIPSGASCVVKSLLLSIRLPELLTQAHLTSWPLPPASETYRE
jgi:hypothetical protein